MSLPVRAQFRSDGCGCPIPVEDTQFGFGRRIPIADMMQRVSPDGKWLAYVVDQGDGGAYILNLQTLERKQIIVHGGLPGERDISWSSLTWCPYDPDLLALDVASFIDTNNSGHSSVYVYNLFFFRISTGESKLITPEKYKAEGIGVTGLFEWMRGSKPNSDTLRISSDTSTEGILPNALYVPQSQSISYVSGYRRQLASDSKGDCLSMIYDSTLPHNAHLYLNSAEILAPRLIQSMTGVSFSPNGILVALSVDPFNGIDTTSRPLDNNWDTTFEQVWVFSSDNPHPDSSQMKIINFQCLYCKYNFQGAWAEFLTDSTLAVSMHKDGDSISPLWEITLDGRIVRQLTRIPQNDAVESNHAVVNSLRVFPNPATGKLEITGGPAGTLRLFDLLGREVMEAKNDGSDDRSPAGITLDVSKLEPGTYFLRVGTESAKVMIAR